MNKIVTHCLVIISLCLMASLPAYADIYGSTTMYIGEEFPEGIEVIAICSVLGNYDDDYYYEYQIEAYLYDDFTMVDSDWYVGPSEGASLGLSAPNRQRGDRLEVAFVVCVKVRWQQESMFLDIFYYTRFDCEPHWEFWMWEAIAAGVWLFEDIICLGVVYEETEIPRLPQTVRVRKVRVTGGQFATQRTGWPGGAFEAAVTGANAIWQQAMAHNYPIGIQSDSYHELHAPTHPNATIRFEISDEQIPDGIMSEAKTLILRKYDLTAGGNPPTPESIWNIYYVKAISGDVQAYTWPDDHRSVVADIAASRTVAHELKHVSGLGREDYQGYPGQDPNSLRWCNRMGEVIQQGLARDVWQGLPPRRVALP